MRHTAHTKRDIVPVRTVAEISARELTHNYCVDARDRLLRLEEAYLREQCASHLSKTTKGYSAATTSYSRLFRPYYDSMMVYTVAEEWK